MQVDDVVDLESVPAVASEESGKYLYLKLLFSLDTLTAPYSSLAHIYVYVCVRIFDI